MALALLSAIPYGGGSQGLIFLSAFTLIAGLGWALLPVLRASRKAAQVLAIAWGIFGLLLLGFGAPSARGWLFTPWLMATGLLVAAVMFKPAQLRWK